MILVILMFLIGVGAVMGGYALVTKLPAALEARKVNQRLADLSAPIEPAPRELAGQHRHGIVAAKHQTDAEEKYQDSQDHYRTSVTPSNMSPGR